MPAIRTQIENWDTTHLFIAATHWNGVAALWEDSFATVHREARMPGGTAFHGASADALRAHTRDLVNTTDQVTGHLRSAAHIAQAGEYQLEEARRAAVEAIQGAEADQFDVAEDLVITDRAHPSTEWELESRAVRAGIHQGNITRTVTELIGIDAEVSTGIGRAITGIQGLDVKMGGGIDSQQCIDAAQAQQDEITRKLLENILKGALLGGAGAGFATGGAGIVPGMFGGALMGGLGTAIDVATGDHQLPPECR